MPDDDLQAAKARARAQALALRSGCDPALGAQLGAHLLAHMPPPPGAVVSGFWPIGEEIDIRPLLQTLHARGHSVLLPETPGRGKPLLFRHWTPQTRMIEERFGTLYPDGPTGTPSWMLIPLLAFDRKGHRLGYGGGFYDRTLAELRAATPQGVTTIGCAYAAQRLDAVPAGDYDARLDAIATEDGVLLCER